MTSRPAPYAPAECGADKALSAGRRVPLPLDCAPLPRSMTGPQLSRPFKGPHACWVRRGARHMRPSCPLAAQCAAAARSAARACHTHARAVLRRLIATGQAQALQMHGRSACLATCVEIARPSHKHACTTACPGFPHKSSTAFQPCLSMHSSSAFALCPAVHVCRQPPHQFDLEGHAGRCARPLAKRPCTSPCVSQTRAGHVGHPPQYNTGLLARL